MISLLSLTAVLLRLWAAGAVSAAVYFATLYGAPMLSSIHDIKSLGSSAVGGWGIFFAVQNLIAIVIGIVVWIFATPLAGLFVRKGESTSVAGEIAPRDIVGIGSFLVGLYYLISSLPRALSGTGVLLYGVILGEKRDASVAAMMDAGSILSSWLIAIVAFVIVTRPYMFAGAFKRIRVRQSDSAV